MSWKFPSEQMPLVQRFSNLGAALAELIRSGSYDQASLIIRQQASIMGELGEPIPLMMALRENENVLQLSRAASEYTVHGMTDELQERLQELQKSFMQNLESLLQGNCELFQWSPNSVSAVYRYTSVMVKLLLGIASIEGGIPEYRGHNAFKALRRILEVRRMCESAKPVFFRGITESLLAEADLLECCAAGPLADQRKSGAAGLYEQALLSPKDPKESRMLYKSIGVPDELVCAYSATLIAVAAVRLAQYQKSRHERIKLLLHARSLTAGYPGPHATGIRAMLRSLGVVDGTNLENGAHHNRPTSNGHVYPRGTILRPNGTAHRNGSEEDES